eukprot:11192713-Lingulodinium_polyedra.AAC.1
MMRSRRPSASAAAHKSHARALHAHTNFLARARSAENAWVVLRYCLGAACELLGILLGRCLNAVFRLLQCCLRA